MPDGGPRAGTSSTIGPFGQADERDEVEVSQFAVRPAYDTDLVSSPL